LGFERVVKTIEAFVGRHGSATIAEVVGRAGSMHAIDPNALDASRVDRSRT
jgi:hypothetical protein